MLQPKRTKFRTVQKARNRGLSYARNAKEGLHACISS